MKELKILFLIFLSGVISKIILLTQIPYASEGGDWFFHAFELPYQFDKGNWTPPTDRPALFSVIIYAVHKALGVSMQEFWLSQIISVFFNSLYIFPAYFIAKKAFSENIARYSAIFMLFTPFLIFSTIYTWPKNAAMFGILSAIYFLFFSENKYRFYYAGLFAGLGFWFHNYALLYIITALSLFLLLLLKHILILFFLNKKVSINYKLSDIAKFAVALGIIILPYYLWLYSYYGTFFTSNFVNYPFANGYEEALIGITRSVTAGEFIEIRISNLLVTLFPGVLLGGNYPTFNLIFIYTHSYAGALSFLFYWFVFSLILTGTKFNKTLLAFIIFPIIFTDLMWGWKEWGFVNQTLQPTVPLIIILGMNELLKIKRAKVIFVVFIIASLIDVIIFYYLYQRLYIIEGGIDNIERMLHNVDIDLNVENFKSIYFKLR